MQELVLLALCSLLWQTIKCDDSFNLQNEEAVQTFCCVSKYNFVAEINNVRVEKVTLLRILKEEIAIGIN